MDNSRFYLWPTLSYHRQVRKIKMRRAFPPYQLPYQFTKQWPSISFSWHLINTPKAFTFNIHSVWKQNRIQLLLFLLTRKDVSKLETFRTDRIEIAFMVRGQLRKSVHSLLQLLCACLLQHACAWCVSENLRSALSFPGRNTVSSILAHVLT